jgi:tetratricopeptide (TPR) repeat protein
MTHFDDEALFQFAEGTSPIAQEIAGHLSACSECASEVGSHQEIVGALQQEDVWEEEVAPPRQFMVDVIGFAEQARLEEERAARLCDEILTGPSSWWPTRLRQSPGAGTAGLVKVLLERMRGTLETSPANALQITALAIDVANELDVASYPCDYVIKLRAQACRDHAYVLVFQGRAPEALEFANRARRLFDQVPLPEYDLARLDLVQAKIVERLERLDEATDLARRAGGTFLRFGDRSRFLGARMHEGALLFNAKRTRQALEVWQSIEGDPALDGLLQVRLIHNIALCHIALGKPELAAPCLQRCAAEFEVLGMETERTRSRWSLAHALIAIDKRREAIPTLRQVWKEFERLELLVDAALSALDLAEQMLVVGETAEVPAICRDLVARFTRAGMPTRAITALAFLREAVAIGQATPSLIQHVHAFLRELPSEQPRLFAPAPAGRDE